MIEAVNSSIAASVIARSANGQQATAQPTVVTTAEPVREVARAPFVSPYISVDTNFDRAILQIRDSDTGDVLNQYPSESQLEAYRRAQQVEPQRLRSPEEVQASLDNDSSVRQQAQVQAQADTQAAQQQVSAPVVEAVSVDTQA